MTPERWREVSAIFDAALACDAAERDALVEDGAVESVANFTAGQLDTCDLAADQGSVVCALIEATADAWIISNFDSRSRRISTGTP